MNRQTCTLKIACGRVVHARICWGRAKAFASTSSPNHDRAIFSPPSPAPVSQSLNLMGRWFRTLFIGSHLCHTSSFLVLFESSFSFIFPAFLLAQTSSEHDEDFYWTESLTTHPSSHHFPGSSSPFDNLKCKQKKSWRNDKKWNCTIK